MADHENERTIDSTGERPMLLPQAFLADSLQQLRVKRFVALK